MGVQVRPVRTFQEREIVFDLLRRAFPATPPDYFPRRTFFDPSYRLSHTFVLEENGRILSTAHVFYGSLWLEGKQVPFAGIGNVATDPEQQGKGYGSRLMRELHKILEAEKRAAIAVLFTATPRFYERLGYRLFHIQEYRIKVTASPSGRWVTFSPEFLDALPSLSAAYCRFLAGPVVKGKENFTHQFAYLPEDRSLFLLALENGRPTGYIRARKEGEEPVVLEFGSTRPEQDFPELLGALLVRSGSATARVGLSHWEAAWAQQGGMVHLQPIGVRNLLMRPLRESGEARRFEEIFPDRGNFWLADVF